jgi:hypothetical protein
VSVLVPLVGILTAAGVPLARYALMERHERTAVAVLQRVQAAQAQFHRRAGGYASDAASLTTACPGETPVLPAESVQALGAAGYTLTVRPAQGAAAVGMDCHGRAVVADYYVAAAPTSSRVAAREAFAGRGDGRLYVFFDGLAPREADLGTGLATPLDARDALRIP